MNLQKKGLAGIILTVGIVVALIAGSAIVYPDLYTKGIPGFLSVGPKSCDKTPFDKDCYCNEEEEQIRFSYKGVPRYLCEAERKAIDVDEPGWEEALKTLAIQKFNQEFPTCDMADCDDPRMETKWELGHGIHYGADGTVQRIAAARCIEDQPFGSIFSNVELDVSKGNVVTNIGCGSYQEVIKGEPGPEPAKLEVTSKKTTCPTRSNIINGHSFTKMEFSSDCDEDNGIGIITINSLCPDSIEKWEEYPYSAAKDLCEITSYDSESATIRCERSCPSNSAFSGMPYTIKATFKQGYFDDYIICEAPREDNGEIEKFLEDETVICGRYQYKCTANGWLRQKDGYSTTAPQCPTQYEAMCTTGGIYSNWYMPGSTHPTLGTCGTNGEWTI